MFIKTDQMKQVTLGGTGAQVLFKLENKKSKSEVKDEIRENKFITDGGLKERQMKYYNSTVFNKTTTKIQSKYNCF
jgi:hypothetical protein